MSLFRPYPVVLAAIGILVSCSAAQEKGEQKKEAPKEAAKNANSKGKELPLPELVTSEEVKLSGDFKTVIVGNENGRYTLSCLAGRSGCLTPTPGRRYMVFNKNTRYRIPGAKEVMGLEFIQEWTAEYKKMENIGLVPEGGSGPFELGMYVLESWKAKEKEK